MRVLQREVWKEGGRYEVGRERMVREGRSE